MTERFEKAYNALYNAFMDNTLAKGSCKACAVGNIVSDAMGGKVYKDEYGGWDCDVYNDWWGEMFCTSSNGQIITKASEHKDIPKYRKHILKLTGYKWNELAEVEKAFENNAKIPYDFYFDYTEKEIMEDQFNGLMAVMDVLIKLDEVNNGEKYKKTFKNKFVTI